MECASTDKGIKLIAALTPRLSLTYDHVPPSCLRPREPLPLTYDNGSEPVGADPQLLRGAPSVGNDPHDGGTGLVVSDPADGGRGVG